jgi:hypothetical protein
MKVHCHVCGKPLRDPVSIARGTGPKCAGIANAGKSFHSTQRIRSRTTYPSVGESLATPNLFSFVEERQDRVPDTLKKFPSDLVELVLSAPAAGTIAMRVKNHRQKRSKQKGRSPIITLREIRRICINLRMLFWPGFSFNGEPLACIPCGDDHWRIGKDGREMSAGDLLSYLSRYGVI